MVGGWNVLSREEWMGEKEVAEFGCEKRLLESGKRRARLWTPLR